MEQEVKRETVYLLAFGRQGRMGDTSPKQLLKLNDETILRRTVRIVREFSPHAEIALVAPESDLWVKQLHVLGVNGLIEPPHRGDTVVETIRQLPRPGIFLLADVVFSRAALATILGSFGTKVFGRRGDNASTGKPCEFFAARLEDEPLVSQALDDLGRGRLRELQARLGEQTMVDIDDWTDDIDSPEEVETVLPILRNLVRQEVLDEEVTALCARTFWTIAGDFPPNKEDVYPEHAIAQEFDRWNDSHWVLEYGCGGGSDTLSYLRRGCTVSAVDLCAANAEVTARRIKEQRAEDIYRVDVMALRQSDQLPYPDETFHAASAHGVLHHIKEPLVSRVIREIRRVLLPGGTFYAMLYTPALETFHKERIAASRASHPGLSHGEAFGWATDGEGCPWAEAYDYDKAKKLFEPLGFTIVSTFEYHQGFFATYRMMKV